MSSLDRREFLARTAGSAGALAFAPSADLYGTSLRGAAPLGIGVIGTGRQGRAILAELGKFEAAQVRALCDVDSGRLRGAKRRAREAEAVADHRAVLDSDVQAVIIATPTHLHEQIALDALQAGKHVYCEAPMAHTVEAARAMARAAREAKTVFQVGLQGRSNPVYNLARTFYRSGALRDLVALQAHSNRKTSWRFGVGDPERDKLLDWRLDPEVSTGLAGEIASHQIDTVSWFVNRLPEAVRGRGSIVVHRDGRTIDDNIVLELHYPDGVTMLYQASLANSYEGTFELFRGSNATIKLAQTHGWMFKEADSPTQGWEVYANRERFHNDEGITLIADATKLAKRGKLEEGIGLPHPPLYYALRDFLLSAGEGHEVAATAADGFRAALIGISAHQAVTGGVPVQLGEVAYEVG